MSYVAILQDIFNLLPFDNLIYLSLIESDRLSTRQLWQGIEKKSMELRRTWIDQSTELKNTCREIFSYRERYSQINE